MEMRRNLPLLMGICFLSQMGGFMILPLFPLYIDKLGLSGWEMGLIFGMFYLGKVAGGVPASALYHRVGAKMSLALMLLMLALCTAGFAMATASLLLVGLRLMQGIASTGLTVIVRSIISDGGNKDNRGLYNGYISSSEGGGMILGPVISGWLALHVPLSVPFWLVTCCCLVALVTVTAIQNEATPISSGSTPSPGLKNSVAAILTPAEQTFQQKETTQDHASDNTPSRPSSGTGSIPVPLTGYIMVHVLEMSAYAVFLTYFALYATQIMQWDAFSASLAFTIAGISTLAAAPFVGLLSDRLGDRLLLCMLGMFLIGVEVVVFLSTSAHLWVYIGMFIGGIGGACYMDSFFAHIGDHTPEANRSSVIGKIVSSAEIGSIASPLIAALLMETSSLYAVFVFNLILIAAAIAVQAIMRSRYRVKP
ncbi:MFS transporter [Paenibacillus sp. TSA_86.1]|uniref:MFS transporter n=1 Tax=Paenibacillus sp. TSA_86.1 TaxID=3415649 RepID=UPI0040465170